MKYSGDKSPKLEAKVGTLAGGNLFVSTYVSNRTYYEEAEEGMH